MSKAPEPLVSADVDLKDFSFTPMFRSRLFGSGFHARVSDAGWRAGVTLWLKSWDQQPAGSLPMDDVDLCRLAELGRDIKAWRKIRADALWGWFECADGRLYHKVVAEGVNEAWQRKCAQRDRTTAARAAREAKRQSQTTLDTTTEDVTISVTDNAASFVTGSKGQGQGQGPKKEEEAKPSDTSTPAAPQFGRADFERIEGACIRALGQDVAPADPVIGPIVLLVQNGASIEIITTILMSEAKRQRKKPIRTWALWAEIVAERLAEAAHPSAPKRGSTPVSAIHVAPVPPVITDEIWRMWFESYTPGNGSGWSRTMLGPPPDEPKCRAPPAMIAEWDARFPDRFRAAG